MMLSYLAKPLLDGLTVVPTPALLVLNIIHYRVAGKFGRRKVWRIYFLSICEKKFGKLIDRPKGYQLQVLVWMVLVWQITDDSPNFLPAKLFCYTVLALPPAVQPFAQYQTKDFNTVTLPFDLPIHYTTKEYLQPQKLKQNTKYKCQMSVKQLT